MVLCCMTLAALPLNRFSSVGILLSSTFGMYQEELIRTYIVENLLAENFQTLRNSVYGRYPTFFQSLLNSSSKEVALLANIVSRDAQSVTAKNIQVIEKASGRSPWDYSAMRIKSDLKKVPVPENNSWIMSRLTKMLAHRKAEENMLRPTDRLTEMINSLCDS